LTLNLVDFRDKTFSIWVEKLHDSMKQFTFHYSLWQYCYFVMWHVYLDEIQLIDNYEVSQQALQCLVDLANAWLLEMAHNTILFGNNWNDYTWTGSVL
jgi:hypothetical protein